MTAETAGRSPAVDDLTAAIVDAYNASSDADRDAGRRWYPAAGAIIASLAEWSGASCETSAAVVAALSPRNPWTWNVQDAAAILWWSGHRTDTLPKVTTFNANRDRAIALAIGGEDWTGSALKVRSFVRNMTGDCHAVTVDVWAVRVATRGRRDAVKSDADYERIAGAYRAAAVIVGETPRDLQATVWIAAQTAGLASNRRGRHDKTLKSGTFAMLVELFTGQLSLGLAQ